jgi:hypothetical protein
MRGRALCNQLGARLPLVFAKPFDYRVNQTGHSPTLARWVDHWRPALGAVGALAEVLVYARHAKRVRAPCKLVWANKQLGANGALCLSAHFAQRLLHSLQPLDARRVHRWARLACPCGHRGRRRLRRPCALAAALLNTVLVVNGKPELE